MACCTVGSRLSEGWVGIVVLSANLRLPPGTKGVACTGHHGLICGGAVTPGHELHVHGGGVGVASPLVLDEQLFDHAGQELSSRFALAGADEHGAADLVEDG